MAQVTLPDGTTLTAAEGTTSAELARQIGPRLGTAAIAAKVNGILLDLGTPLADSSHVEIVTPEDEAGLEVMGYATQAHFLINCGILDLLAGLEPGSQAYLRRAAQVQKLLSPSEMGDLFKVMALAKGLDAPLLGFARGDRRHTL